MGFFDRVRMRESWRTRSPSASSSSRRLRARNCGFTAGQPDGRDRSCHGRGWLVGHALEHPPKREKSLALKGCCRNPSASQAIATSIRSERAVAVFSDRNRYKPGEPGSAWLGFGAHCLTIQSFTYPTSRMSTSAVFGERPDVERPANNPPDSRRIRNRH